MSRLPAGISGHQAGEDVKSTIETLMDDLMTVSDGVRRRAVDEYMTMAGRRTDDGVQVQRPVKVGRNDLCPCGSGQRWKRCCGAPNRTH